VNTIRWILPLAGAGMLAAASLAGLERTEAFFEPSFDFGEVQASWDAESARPEAVVVPSRTPVAVILEASLSTRTAQAGDRFHARIAAPVRVHGRVVIPRGAEVEGHVATSEPPGSGSRPGRIQLTYELVRFGGRAYGLNSHSQVYEAGIEPSGRAPEIGPEMEFDSGATLEFELDQPVSMMGGSAVLAVH
jgi:hypothetical protein